VFTVLLLVERAFESPVSVQASKLPAEFDAD